MLQVKLCGYEFNTKTCPLSAQVVEVLFGVLVREICGDGLRIFILRTSAKNVSSLLGILFSLKRFSFPNIL